LLRGAAISDVENVDVQLYGTALAERESAAYAGIPSGKPRSPQLSVAAICVDEPVCGRQRIRDCPAADRKCCICEFGRLAG
jgi:hypothetical protein